MTLFISKLVLLLIIFFNFNLDTGTSHAKVWRIDRLIQKRILKSPNAGESLSREGLGPKAMIQMSSELFSDKW